MHRLDEPLLITNCQELFELELTDRFTPVALVQGAYYLVTGIWPLVSIASFQFVTGPKTDLWLVKTVGVLIAVIGVGLLIAAYRRRTTLEIRLIAIGSALGLIAIDVGYVFLDVIPPIYLLDAVVELVLVVWWGVLWKRQALVHSAKVADTPQIYGDTVGHAYKIGDERRSSGGEP
jgi:energy-converting hydrogenase Eha subunit E